MCYFKKPTASGYKYMQCCWKNGTKTWHSPLGAKKCPKLWMRVCVVKIPCRKLASEPRLKESDPWVKLWRQLYTANISPYHTSIEDWFVMILRVGYKRVQWFALLFRQWKIPANKRGIKKSEKLKKFINPPIPSSYFIYSYVKKLVS